jgi:hypothetical protein
LLLEDLTAALAGIIDKHGIIYKKLEARLTTPSRNRRAEIMATILEPVDQLNIGE